MQEGEPELGTSRRSERLGAPWALKRASVQEVVVHKEAL
jgi:hypothetical protein